MQVHSNNDSNNWEFRCVARKEFLTREERESLFLFWGERVCVCFCIVPNDTVNLPPPDRLVQGKKPKSKKNPEKPEKPHRKKPNRK